MRIGVLFNIPISVHWSWAIGFIFITWTLAKGSLPMPAALDETQRWIIAGFITLSLFGSVLLHELAHSLTAKRLGYRVMGITLMIFGGASLIQETRRRAAHDFLIAFAGPFMSLVLGLIGIVMVAAVSTPNSTGMHAMFEGWLRYMGWMNLILAAFNMLPGIPLDGGRVLHSAVWGLTGSQDVATRVSTLSGRVVSLLIIVYGIYLIFVAENLIGGIWLVFIGMFIGSAASGEARWARRRREERSHVGVTVREAMSPTPTALNAGMTVEEAIRLVFSRYPRSTLPVVKDGGVIGMLSRSDIGLLAARSGIDQSLTVGDVTRKVDLLPIGPDEDISVAARLMENRKVDGLLVFDGQRLVGVLGMDEISRFIASGEDELRTRGLGRSAGD